MACGWHKKEVEAKRAMVRRLVTAKEELTMLLIEVILTIVAWRKGWRWRVLVPWGVALGASLLLGMAVGASGGSVEDVSGLAVLLELGFVGWLVAMAVRAPRVPVQAPCAEVAVSDGRGKISEFACHDAANVH